MSSAAVGTASWNDLTVKMGTTTAAAFTTGARIGGLTTVYSAPVTRLPAPITARGWLELTLSTPFAWNMTDNLIVEISQTGFTTGIQTVTSSVPGSRQYGTVTGTTGTADATLMNFGYDLVTTPCSGTPPPAAAVATTTAPCLGDVVPLSISPASLTTGISYQWQEFDGTGWINVVGGTGATTPGYMTAPVVASKRYRVKMTCTSGTFPETISSEVVLTPAIVPLPYVQDFESITVADQMPACMRADGLGSAVRTYTANQTTYNRINHTAAPGSKFASFYYSPAGTHGIYTPAFNLQAGKSYLFRFWYITGNSTGGAPTNFTSLGAYYGTSPDVAGMTNLIGTTPASPVNNTAYQEFTEAFTPAASGVYYIGILAAHTAAVVSYVSVDDIGLSELTPCTGRPVAGTITGSPASPCPRQNFTLSRTGGTDLTAFGNLTIQWQDSTATGWQNSLGASATSNNYTTNITASTTYRVIITCTNSGQSDISASYRVNVASFLNCYCASAPTAATLIDIGNVTLKSVPAGATILDNGNATPLYSNSTAINTYSNFTALPPAVLHRDSGYNIAVSEIVTGTTFYASRAYAYIDFDQNGIFDASELIINQITGSTTSPAGRVAGNFTVPATAKLGITAMRVIMAYPTTSAVDPCVAYTNGETEDYWVKIDYAPCNGPTNAGTAVASAEGICKGYTVDLYDTTHEYQRSRLSWSWQSSLDGGLSWTAMPGSANKDTLLNVTVTGATSFRVKMVCDASGDSTFSVPVNVRINAPYECYCYSQSDGGRNDVSDIGAVVIGNMINATPGPHIDNPTAIRRRTDYTQIKNIVLNTNNTFRLSVYHVQRNSKHKDARISVFVDYNNDLQYQVNSLPNSERIYTAVTNEQLFYLDTIIRVPDAVIPNVLTGLRVILNDDTDPSAPANMGCGPYVSGETEDYVVMFKRVPQSVGNVTNLEQVSLYPNPTNGKFRISATATMGMDKVNVIITTITGQTVLQQSYNNIGNKFSDDLDLSEVAKGIYFVTLKTASGDKMVQKLVVR